MSRTWTRREALAAASSFAALLARPRGARAAEEWSNWSRSVSWTPARVERPASIAEIVASVERAAAAGDVLKVTGTGHSFVPLCATDGTLQLLTRMSGIESIDADRSEATVLAGTKLGELHEPLLAAGFALETLPDVDRQAVAGAIATSTHGTGRNVPTMSALVTGATLVDGRGRVVECSGDQRPDILQAVRVHLGVLGVLARVRLRLVPAFRLHERTRIVPYEECVATLEENIASHRHYEFFWVSDRDACLSKSLDPTDDPEDREEFEDAERLVGERVGWSGAIFPSLRNRRFNEIEYSLPAEHGPDCLAELRTLMLGRHRDVTWPLEYRTIAADDIWLAPSQGRATVTISAHQDARLPYREFFADVEAIFRNHAGRPHWGKIHTRTPAELAALYPHWNDFLAVRAELDPEGRFLNPYTRGLLGL